MRCTRTATTAPDGTTTLDATAPDGTTTLDATAPDGTTTLDATAPDGTTTLDGTTAPDDATAIANEMYRYAELIDAGLFAELGELMEHCTFRYGEQAVAGPSGAVAIAESYRATVIIYADGTPRTRHVTTNPIIEIDGDTARARSTYTVLQQAPDSPIETIISGPLRRHSSDGSTDIGASVSAASSSTWSEISAATCTLTSPPTSETRSF